MTPIEQNIQAAIDSGAGYSFTLVMAALKPLLDDARELAKWAGNGTGIPAIEFEALYKRILAATEPSSQERGVTQHALVQGDAGSTPNVPIPAWCDICHHPLSKHIDWKSLTNGYVWKRCTDCGCRKPIPQPTPGPGADSSPCGQVHGGAICVLPNGHAGHHQIRFVDTEQSRQATAGVPDNDGVTQKQPHPLGVYGVDWVMTMVGSGGSRWIYGEKDDALFWWFADEEKWSPNSSCLKSFEISLPESEALAFLADHPIPPDLLKLAAIPTITGTADAMKTPGPVPLVKGSPVTLGESDVCLEIERLFHPVSSGTGINGELLAIIRRITTKPWSGDIASLDKRVAALEKGKVAT